MSLMRTAILKASANPWMRKNAPRYGFLRRTVTRFMPGETIDDALAAARQLAEKRIATLVTQLGENIENRTEAESVTNHYLDVLKRISAASLPTEVSVKLTQLGLDLDREFCYANLAKLIEATPPDKTLWIDMEQSPYVDVTLEIYLRARKAYANVGVCVQAYLYRTQKDLDSLIAIGAAVRLVKGAYNEPAEIAYPRKNDVDASYMDSGQKIVKPGSSQSGRACRDRYTRSRVDREPHRLGHCAGSPEESPRIPNALRHSARRAIAPHARRLPLRGPDLLRHVLVPVVYAASRRTPRQRSLPRS